MVIPSILRLMPIMDESLHTVQSQPSRTIRQRNTNSLLKATPQSLVNVPRKVYCSQNDDHLGLIRVRILSCRHTIHLHQNLRLDSSACLVLIADASLRAHRFYFIYENGAGRVKVRHLEQKTHQLFRLALVLRYQAGQAQIKKSSLAFSGDSFGQHCFVSAGRSDHQNAFVRSSDAAKLLRIFSPAPLAADRLGTADWEGCCWELMSVSCFQWMGLWAPLWTLGHFRTPGGLCMPWGCWRRFRSRS
ncbi:hypothetical protein BpHYR1_005105 [Brachionus plicatilis]|uniref:Uncharacterized protein n=1 Tax=Brachionus plicatilis TaxID=10195 RepID=A0A3M7R4P7_BRAPC|nr:hypothetical protein BpHYR1_005105 [Brachionus plicatilis]